MGGSSKDSFGVPSSAAGDGVPQDAYLIQSILTERISSPGTDDIHSSTRWAIISQDKRETGNAWLSR